MEDEELKQIAEVYAASRGCRVGESPGSGLHGIVCLLESNAGPGQAALKIHRCSEPYHRERQIYERLRERGKMEVCLPDGLVLQIPLLLHTDDDLLALEMTTVSVPFVLDFASADLDERRELPEGSWEEREAHWREVWGERWEGVQLVLAQLQRVGVFMYDPSPSNIRFE